VTSLANRPPLHIDFETRSTCPLDKCGVHVYAAHPTTDTWCAAFALGDDPIESWLPGEPVPPEIVEQVKSGGEFWAHNAPFERLIWQHILGPRYGWPIPAFDRWQCTMARACVMALPSSLKDASAALGLGEAKDADGHRLMMQMSKPRGYNADGGPIWWDTPDRLRRLVKYNKQDVAVERALHGRVNDLRPLEHLIWLLDQRINDRGLKVDRELCAIIQPLIAQSLDELNREIRAITGGAVASVYNVASLAQYCRSQGVETDSVAAHVLEELLLRSTLPPAVRRALEIRAEASKASVKKIEALLRGCSSDGRARGLLAYHIASTGRWAGRRFQPQNIKRPVNHDQDTLIDLLRQGSLSSIRLLAGEPLEVIGDVLRGLIIAAPMHAFFAGDFSSIESRVLAWLAGESWKLQAFREDADIYVLLYKRAFHVREVDSNQRQVGKVMDLACGYQGSVGAFQSMASGYRVKISDVRAKELVMAWREAHPNTVNLWFDVERAAIHACAHPGLKVTVGKLAFRRDGPFLYMKLPSGRLLTYPFAKLMMRPTPWGEDKRTLTHKSVVHSARQVVPEDGNSSSWARVATYGGSLVENAVQAIARDLLAEAMLRIERAGFPIVLTVHDEVVSEAPVDRSLDEFKRLLIEVPDWARGLPISAKAWSGPRYRKD
jgi:DNA polymerase bacteriophage-type